MNPSHRSPWPQVVGSSPGADTRCIVVCESACFRAVSNTTPIPQPVNATIPLQRTMGALRPTRPVSTDAGRCDGAEEGEIGATSTSPQHTGRAPILFLEEPHIRHKGSTMGVTVQARCPSSNRHVLWWFASEACHSQGVVGLFRWWFDSFIAERANDWPSILVPHLVRRGSYVSSQV